MLIVPSLLATLTPTATIMSMIPAGGIFVQTKAALRSPYRANGSNVCGADYDGYVYSSQNGVTLGSGRINKNRYTNSSIPIYFSILL